MFFLPTFMPLHCFFLYPLHPFYTHSTFCVLYPLHPITYHSTSCVLYTLQPISYPLHFLRFIPTPKKSYPLHSKKLHENWILKDFLEIEKTSKRSSYRPVDRFLRSSMLPKVFTTIPGQVPKQWEATAIHILEASGSSLTHT